MAPVPRGSQIRAPGSATTQATTFLPTGEAVNRRLIGPAGAGTAISATRQSAQLQTEQQEALGQLAGQQQQIQQGQQTQFGNFLEQIRQNQKKINRQVKRERNQVLGELDALESGIGRDINVQVQGAVAAENAQNVETIRRTQEQFAELGRPVNPFVISQLSNRLAAQSNTRIRQLETDLRAQARQERFTITQARTDIFQSTGREALSDLELLEIAGQLGTARGAGAGTTFRLGGTSSGALAARNAELRQRRAAQIAGVEAQADTRGRKRTAEARFTQLTPEERLRKFGTTEFGEGGTFEPRAGL